MQAYQFRLCLTNREDNAVPFTPPALAWMPFNFLALPWLVINTVVCLFIARALLRKEA